MSKRWIFVIALLGAVASAPFTGIAAADCAPVEAVEALEFVDAAFVGTPLGPVGKPGDGGQVGEQTWTFSVQGVAVERGTGGDIGPTIEVTFDNWYSSIDETAIGQQRVVFARSVDGQLRSDICVFDTTPDELVAAMTLAGLGELKAPAADAPGVSVSTVLAPLEPVVTQPAPTTTQATSSGMTVVENDSTPISDWKLWAPLGVLVAGMAAGAVAIRKRR